jgi:predicted nucleic acid-binding Zn ribbon protein
MPIYTYTCEGCGWHGERIVLFDSRDEQYCEQESCDTDGSGKGRLGTCGHRLQRREDLELTSHTPYAWKP